MHITHHDEHHVISKKKDLGVVCGMYLHLDATTTMCLTAEQISHSFEPEIPTTVQNAFRFLGLLVTQIDGPE